MQNSHGGKRDGAGRKPGPEGAKVTTSVTLTQEALDYLETLQQSRGPVLEAALRRTIDFKRWKAARKQG
jgi:hypothetical protein